MAAQDASAARLRRTVAAYMRRLIRVGLAAQTLSSSGIGSPAISRLVGSAVALASQLQRAMVVRVVGAPLVRRKPARRRVESAEAHPESSLAASTEVSSQAEQGTDWQEAAAPSVALAEMETQPFAFARMLPSMVLARQAAFRPLASMNAAVAGAVGNLGLGTQAAPSGQTAFRDDGQGLRGSLDTEVAIGTAASSSPFPAARTSPSSTSFGAEAPRESTAGGSSGTTSAYEAPSRTPPSDTSSEPPGRNIAATSPVPAHVSPPAGKGTSREPGTPGTELSPPPSSSPPPQAASGESATKFSSTEDRPSPSTTTLEPSSTGSPYSPQDAAPASTGGAVSALGVVTALRTAGSSMAFNLNSAALEAASPSMSPPAPGATFVAPASRTAQQGTSFQPNVPSTSQQSAPGASIAGTGDTVFASSSPAVQGLGLSPGARNLDASVSPAPTAARGSGLLSSAPSEARPSLNALISPPSDTRPASLQSGSVASGQQAPSGDVATSPSSTSADLPVAPPVAPPSALSAQVNSGSSTRQEFAALAGARASGVAGTQEGSYAVPAGLGMALSTPVVDRATQLSLQVSALASPSGSAPLPLRADVVSEQATTVPPRLGVGQGSSAGMSSVGIAYSLSTTVASLGLGTTEPAPAPTISGALLSRTTSSMPEAAEPLSPPIPGRVASGLPLSSASQSAASLSESTIPPLDSTESSVAEVNSLTAAASTPREASQTSEEGDATSYGLPGISSEPTVIGSQLGTSQGKGRPGLPHHTLLFGDRWLASVAAATGIGGSLLDALAFPASPVSNLIPVSLVTAHRAASPPAATAGPTGEPVLLRDIPARPGEATRPRLDQGLAPDARPRYTPAGLLAPDTTSPAPTPASRSVWEQATLLPGILTPAFAVRDGGGRSAIPAYQRNLSSSRAPAAEPGPPGTPGGRWSGVLAAAGAVRRAILEASAGHLGGGQVPELSSRSARGARPGYGGSGLSAGAPQAWSEPITMPTQVTASPGPSPLVEPRRGEGPSPTFAPSSSVLAAASAAYPSEATGNSTPPDSRMRGGPTEAPRASSLETTYFPAIQTALTARLRLAAPGGPLPSLVIPSGGGGTANLVRSAPPVPGLHGSRLGAPGQETAPREASPGDSETGPRQETVATDFFGLDAVAQTFSLAYMLPSTAVRGGAVVPRRVVAPAASGTAKPSSRVAHEAEVRFAPPRPPEFSEPWRSQPEEAISDALADASIGSPATIGEPPHEPDDRDLRRRIEKMIDEELRRYGYQP